MGYTTEFQGTINISPEPSPEIIALVNGLADTRRMKRDPEKLKEMGFDGDYGIEGEFFFNPDSTCYGQEMDISVIDHNTPPKDQPGLWLHWIINGDFLQWSGDENFYDYVKWLEYLIDKIFKPNGYTLNGKVRYRGENFDDMGAIYVTDNLVTNITGYFA